MNLLKTLLLLCLAVNVQAKDWVLALSPNQANLTEHAHTALKHLIGQPAGTTVTVVDGVRLETIGRFEVPKDPRYRHPRTILAKNAGLAEKLQSWAKVPTEGPVPQNLMVPSLLEFVADLGSDVVLVGSMRYHDADEPASSMLERFPGDGHLFHPPTETPYGTQGIDLAGLRVHWVNTDPRPQRMQRHVRRFWHLYAEAAGGVLVQVVRTLGDVQLSRTPRPLGYSVQDSNKLEMNALTPLELGALSIFERGISYEPLPENSVPQPITIGLSWASCTQCDLDLYARPFDLADTLYFAATESAQGRYFKDFTTSPATSNGFETIEFSAPVDLQQLLIGVNFYAGTAQNGVEAELRLSVGNQTFEHRIHLPGVQGRGGGDMRVEMRQGYSREAVILRGVDLLPQRIEEV